MSIRAILFLTLIFLIPLNRKKSTLNFLEAKHPFWQSELPVAHNSAPDSILTVVSYNIKFGIKLEEAIDELGIHPFKGADIILLQEMDEWGTQYISRKLSYNYIYYPISNHPRHQKNFGNAILSKWPISQSQKIILPHAQPINRMKRAATVATIHYGDTKIRTFSVHLETPILSRSKRLQQLQFALSEVENSLKDELVIMGGDFNSLFPNDVSMMVEMCRAKNLEWNTEYLGHTLSRFNFVKPQLDHIFSRGFVHLNSGKMNDPKGSDHFPIWTKLEIP